MKKKYKKPSVFNFSQKAVTLSALASAAAFVAGAKVGKEMMGDFSYNRENVLLKRSN